tara:strand:+ start:1732 stop:2325 length:594 start_codon:yes stop_codon:yes gene_type:complete
MKFKGKEYAEVKDRVIAFLDEFPQGSINTELLSSCQIIDTATGEKCNEYTFKATITPNPLQQPDIYFTGHAAERDNTGFVNKTSAVENCETSAVGRALAFAGYGGDFAIASATEVANAKAKQKVIQPTIKSLEEIDLMASQCEKAKLITTNQHISFKKKRGEGYYDTKARVQTAKEAFQVLLDNDKTEELKNVKENA